MDIPTRTLGGRAKARWEGAMAWFWRHRVACAAAGMAWIVGAHYVTVGINVTRSLPYHVVLVVKGRHVHRGNLVAFRWHGGGPYPAGSEFVKYVGGAAGDVVTRKGRAFYVNGIFRGRAKRFSTDGVPLAPGPTGTLGPGDYYVYAPNPDSLDSRYALTGWIHQDEIIGRAYAWF